MDLSIQNLGLFFPLEVQLIHYKESLGSFENALNDPDGLAVLSVFFQVKNHEIYIFKKQT